MNKKAFTLSEVLITLAIIGVVAAMTLPTLIAKHREKVTVNKLKKAYSMLQQGLLLAINKYGSPADWDAYQYDDEDESDSTVTRTYPNNLAEQFKTVKVCGFKSEGCFTTGYKYLNGSSERDFENLNNRYYKFITSDGMTIAIEGYYGSCHTSNKNSSSCGEIWVDVNGKAPPNTVGKDLFLFTYTIEKIRPYGHDKTTLPLSSTGCRIKSSGHECTAWVLHNENLDYLHCDDLSWVGKTSCSK